ncbi:MULTISPECIES: VOC family protein [unclassified Beijerinckia]|uniref:VOC family protein n=1 Tax=unclassified Beijerinckia TaxID=2638183 RepID=UPI0008985C94|nr:MULTISPECIES: VOC family protein [unclassified Beijerinckia]MDH7798453.1 catechol 2,3-dioxygenase-like lactoylglutathione lyase family enzyme [Beijerinckia sp. GAS462]SED21387.1 Catechol 2,3-dioxygenase [Beijerinckia sp. 28-YEA-48]
MLDHIGFAVTNFAEAKAFYTTALAPLGLTLLMEVTKEQTGGDEHAGFGRDNKPFFWIGTSDKPKGGVHVALTTPTRGHVDAFYAAAIAAGGRDNGKPGLRPHYHPNYYGAFVLDRDGNNIEAVCHAPG